MQFLLLPVYTRYLTPDDNGVIAMLIIVTLLFGPLANLGMTNAVFRRLQSGQGRSGLPPQVLGTGLLSVVLSGRLSCLAISLGSFILPFLDCRRIGGRTRRGRTWFD